MKPLRFLLTIFLFTNACTSNVQQEAQRSIATNEENENTIYLDDFESSSFTSADFVKLQEITKYFPERLDVVPNDIAFRLTSQDTIHSIVYCKWIDSVKGVFKIETNEFNIDFLVSFSKQGEPLDYIAFKGAKRQLVNGRRIYNKFYSEYYFLDKYIVINTLDTSLIVAHPHLAKIVKSDYWYVNEIRRFSLKND